MSFRRKPEEATTRQRWNKFCQETKSLADRTGLPLTILSERDIFDFFLMHGSVDYQRDPTQTTLDQLTAEQRGALQELIVEYLRNGFDDPGLGILSARERDEVRRRAGQKAE